MIASPSKEAKALHWRLIILNRIQITFHKVDDSFLGLILPYFKLSAFLSQSKKLFAITCHIIVNMVHFVTEQYCGNFRITILVQDRFNTCIDEQQVLQS